MHARVSTTERLNKVDKMSQLVDVSQPLPLSPWNRHDDGYINKLAIMAEMEVIYWLKSTDFDFLG